MTTIGTKSVLLGAHCFFIHPFFVLWAYWKLEGFTLDPRIILACFIHDLGYLGKKDIDGPDGKYHPILGAEIMHFLFDDKKEGEVTWKNFCLLHSRYYADLFKLPYSKLCIADKYAICLTPWWIYLPLVCFTGEIDEYLKNSETIDTSKILRERPKYFEGSFKMLTGAVFKKPFTWYVGLQEYMRVWVEENK